MNANEKRERERQREEEAEQREREKPGYQTPNNENPFGSMRSRLCSTFVSLFEKKKKQKKSYFFPSESTREREKNT